jgi:hypothetical protein
MCNANNHLPGCDCGWGGSGSGSTVNLSTQISRVLKDRKTYFTSKTEDAKTYLTICWFCKEAEVYYHTQGFGDCVLFDSLGSPWQVHQCWLNYRNEERTERNIFNNSYSGHNVLHLKNSDQQKRSIIIGAARQIEGVTFDSLGFYGANEEVVACQIGLSVEKFRQVYGHLYNLFFGEIRLLNYRVIRE